MAKILNRLCKKHVPLIYLFIGLYFVLFEACILRDYVRPFAYVMPEISLIQPCKNTKSFS